MRGLPPAALCLASLALVLSGCSSSSWGGSSSTHPQASSSTHVLPTTTTAHPSSSSTSSSSSATTSTAPPPSHAGIAIAGSAFSPQTVNVKAGTVVTWSNRDPFAHTVSSDSGDFDSGNLPGGAQYEHTFPTPGTFAYHCAIHSGMHGTVTVTA